MYNLKILLITPIFNKTVKKKPPYPIELIKDNIAQISTEDVLTVIEPKDAMIEYYGNTINHDQYKLMANDKKLMQNLVSAYDDLEDDMDEEDQIMFDFVDLHKLGNWILSIFRSNV